jgi:hypothetical protein
MTDHGTLTGLTDDDHPQYLLKSLADAKGDLLVATAADTLGRLAVGTNGQILTANSAQSTGLQWIDRPWMSSDLVKVDQPITASAPTNVFTTASGTPHTKGAYSDLIASTSGACTMIRLDMYSTATAAADTGNLVDIATGTAGNEVVIAADLNAGYAPPLVSQHLVYWLPIAVPSGTRLSARSQATIASDTVSIQIATFNGTNKTVTAIDTIGTVSASSRGTNVVAGIGDAEGNWTTITASTANAYTGLLWSIGGASDTTVLGANGLLDIAQGAAASEVAIVSNVAFSSDSSENIYQQIPLPVNSVSIAAGVRLAARIQSSAAGAQSFDVTLYGLR